MRISGWARVVPWVGMLWAKALAASHADGDGGAAFGRRSPRWGRHFRAPPTFVWGSLGESPVQFLDRRRRRHWRRDCGSPA